jgi:hypothetical protein
MPILRQSQRHPRQIQARRVTDIASPLFKTDFPGAPLSKSSPRTDTHGATFGFKEQDELLERCISLAKQFKTERIRCFDFWRLDDQAPYREAINAKLLEAANIAGKQNLLLVLENEFECNTATAREAARTLAAVQSPHLKLNWDPGNAVARGEARRLPAGLRSCSPKTASATATSNAPSSSQVPKAASNGRPSARAFPTGTRSSARSNKPATATPSASKPTGPAAVHPKPPLASAGPE